MRSGIIIKQNKIDNTLHCVDCCPVISIAATND